MQEVMLAAEEVMLAAEEVMLAAVQTFACLSAASPYWPARGISCCCLALLVLVLQAL